MCASFAYAETHIITIKGLSDGNKVFDNSVNPVYSFFSEDNLFRFDCDPNLGASKPNYNKAGDLRLNAKNTFTINYNGSDQISKISFARMAAATITNGVSVLFSEISQKYSGEYTVKPNNFFPCTKVLLSMTPFTFSKFSRRSTLQTAPPVIFAPHI